MPLSIRAYPSIPHVACLFGPLTAKTDAHPVFFRYEKKITDYNFGSLIRTDAMKEYSETNTIFGSS